MSKIYYGTDGSIIREINEGGPGSGRKAGSLGVKNKQKNDGRTNLVQKGITEATNDPHELMQHANRLDKMAEESKKYHERAINNDDHFLAQKHLDAHNAFKAEAQAAQDKAADLIVGKNKENSQDVFNKDFLKRSIDTERGYKPTTSKQKKDNSLTPMEHMVKANEFRDKSEKSTNPEDKKSFLESAKFHEDEFGRKMKLEGEKPSKNELHSKIDEVNSKIDKLHEAHSVSARRNGLFNQKTQTIHRNILKLNHEREDIIANHNQTYGTKFKKDYRANA